jgi:hypothetical protein
MKTRRNTSEQTGSTLIITLATAGILGAVLGTYLSMASQENLKVKRSIGWNAALPMAEAGIEDGCSHVTWNPTNFNWTSDGWLFDTNTFTYSKSRTLGDGYYKVSLSGWFGGIATITSQGYAAWTGSNYISRTVSVNIQTPTPVLPSGLIAFNIGFGGTFNADSFDSRTNTYSTLGRYDKNKRTAHALVASRPGSTGFNVSGTTDIRGYVATSVGGLVTVSGSGIVGDLAYNTKGTIQPGHQTNTFDTVYPPVTAPFGATLPGVKIPSSGTNASGQLFDYVLNGGAYYAPSMIAGTMYVASDTTLFIAGGTTIPVIYFNTAKAPKLTLFFGGPSLTFPNGVGGGKDITLGNAPPQCWLIVLPTCSLLKWTGGTFTGVIYGPTMPLESSGNAELQGAIVANSFTCTGTFDFHFDDATSASDAKKFAILTWAEL